MTVGSNGIWKIINFSELLKGSFDKFSQFKTTPILVVCLSNTLLCYEKSIEKGPSVSVVKHSVLLKPKSYYTKQIKEVSLTFWLMTHSVEKLFKTIVKHDIIINITFRLKCTGNSVIINKRDEHKLSALVFSSTYSIRLTVIYWEIDIDFLWNIAKSDVLGPR